MNAPLPWRPLTVRISTSFSTLVTAMARAGSVAFAAGALALAASAGVQAAEMPVATDQVAPADQASPKPAASPAGTTNPGPSTNPGSSSTTGGNSGPQPASPARPATPAQALSHLPIIDFVVTFTQPAYYTNMSQLPHYDPIDLGGTVRFPISRKLSLFFDRITEGTINQPLEKQLINGVPNLPKDTRDVILQYHGTWTFNRNLTMDLGESFRHRIFSSGNGKDFAFNTNISAQPFPYTLSSTEHHFGYLGFSYTTRPWKEFWNSTFVFSETLDRQNVDHNVAITCTGAMVAAGINRCTVPGNGGLLDERPGTQAFYETTQGISWILPVDAKHGTSFLLNERWGYLNFYENTPYPWRWTSALTYQLSKRFSPGFTLALRHSDLHEALVSAPFPAPSTVHVGSWDIIGTFHYDTNSLFH